MSYSDVLAQMLQYIMNWMGTNYLFVALFCVCLIYLVVASKEKRKTIVLPTVILIILIYNPILYKYIWYRIVAEEQVYWRLFWCIPFVPVVATAVVELAAHTRNYLIKISLLVVMVTIIILCGNNMYTSFNFYGVNQKSPFEKAYNMYKIEPYVTNLADQMMSNKIDGTIIVVAPADVTNQLRQYSLRFNVCTLETLDYVSGVDTSAACDRAELTKANFIIINQNSDFKPEYLADYGYQLVGTVLVNDTKKYGLYKKER